MRVDVYDSGSKAGIDRYTVIIGDSVYGMSESPTTPNGFNQYCGELSGLSPNLLLGTKQVDFRNLNEKVQRAIYERMKE
jgi:hypothetical protein